MTRLLASLSVALAVATTWAVRERPARTGICTAHDLAAGTRELLQAAGWELACDVLGSTDRVIHVRLDWADELGAQLPTLSANLTLRCTGNECTASHSGHHVAPDAAVVALVKHACAVHMPHPHMLPMVQNCTTLSTGQVPLVPASPHAFGVRMWHYHTQHPLELTDVLNGFATGPCAVPELRQVEPAGCAARQDAANNTDIPAIRSRTAARAFHDMLGAGTGAWRSFSRAQCVPWQWAAARWVSRWFLWLNIQGQTHVHWILLRDEQHAAGYVGACTRWARLAAMTSLAHRFGLRVGVDLPVAFQQQESLFMTGVTGSLASQVTAIRSAVDWAASTGLDYLATESGTSEFSHPSVSAMLAWLNEAARHAWGAYGMPMWVKIHCSTEQVAHGFAHPTRHDTLDFNHLPLVADPRVGGLAHTVQFWGLDDVAPVYSNQNFSSTWDFITAATSHQYTGQIAATQGSARRLAELAQVQYDAEQQPDARQTMRRAVQSQSWLQVLWTRAAIALAAGSQLVSDAAAAIALCLANIAFALSSTVSGPQAGVGLLTLLQHALTPPPVPAPPAATRSAAPVPLRRSVIFQPETSYFINVDNHAGLFLPLYAERRLSDYEALAFAAQASGQELRVDGVANFDSGSTLGYWINNVAVMQAAGSDLRVPASMVPARRWPALSMTAPQAAPSSDTQRWSLHVHRLADILGTHVAPVLVPPHLRASAAHLLTRMALDQRRLLMYGVRHGVLDTAHYSATDWAAGPYPDMPDAWSACGAGQHCEMPDMLQQRAACGAQGIGRGCTGIAYLSGHDTWAEVEGKLKVPPKSGTQAHRTSLGEAANNAPKFGKPTAAQIMPLLRAMNVTAWAHWRSLAQLHALAQQQGTKHPSASVRARLWRDVLSSAQHTAQRAEQVVYLYQAVTAARAQDAYEWLGRAADLAAGMQRTYRAAVAVRAGGDTPPWVIHSWGENPTCYPWRYLWAVDAGYYAWRDVEQALFVLADQHDPPAGAWQHVQTALSPSNAARRSVCWRNVISPVEVVLGQGRVSRFARRLSQLLRRVPLLSGVADCLAAPAAAPDMSSVWLQFLRSRSSATSAIADQEAEL